MRNCNRFQKFESNNLLRTCFSSLLSEQLEIVNLRFYQIISYINRNKLKEIMQTIEE